MAEPGDGKDPSRLRHRAGRDADGERKCGRSGREEGYMGREIVHVAAFLELMQALTGDRSYRRVVEDLRGRGLDGEGGGYTMTDLIGKAWREGIETGVRQGIQQGVQQGVQEGIQRGVRQGLVAAYREFGVTYEETERRLKEKFSLTDAEAEREMQLYWR